MAGIWESYLSNVCQHLCGSFLLNVLHQLTTMISGLDMLDQLIHQGATTNPGESRAGTNSSVCLPRRDIVLLRTSQKEFRAWTLLIYFLLQRNCVRSTVVGRVSKKDNPGQETLEPGRWNLELRTQSLEPGSWSMKPRTRRL